MIFHEITNTGRIQTVQMHPSQRFESKVRTSNYPRVQKISIDSLPMELIVEIFTLVASGSLESLVCSPIILSHVSAHWRFIALKTSSLWTSIALTFPYSHAELQRMQFALEHSQRRPLDIHIDLRDEEWDWQDSSHEPEMQADDMFQIFDIIVCGADRWRTVEILADNWQPIHAFLALSVKLSSLPILERLLLSRCNAYFGIPGVDFAPPELAHPIELFGGNALLPKLRHAVFAGVHVDWSCCGLENLLGLEFKYLASDVVPTMGEFVRIIQASPNMESLTLIACIPRYDRSALPCESHLYIPTLRRFSFGWSCNEDAIMLLSALQLPAIEELYLEDVMLGLHEDEVEQNSTTIIEHLISFDHRAASPAADLPSRACYSLSGLRSLTLEAVRINSATFHRFLERTSNLEELDLLGMDIGLIRVFSKGDLSLCPKLRKLNVRVWCLGSSDDVVRSVRSARPQLQVEVMMS